jgi:methionyl-tRNA formyltransferase
MPGNYIDLLEALLKSAAETQKTEGSPKWEIAGFVSLKTLDLGLVKTLIGLPLLGVTQLTESLLTNILELPLGKRDKLARKYKVRHIKAETMNDPQLVSVVRNLNIDVILNIRTRCIYREDILNAPNWGCLNIHHGLLPEYRGTFCDLYALYEGRPAGFSLHEMVQKVDAGRIFEVVTVDQGGERNYRNYLKKTVQYEVDTLNQFFYNCAKRGGLPEGLPNTPKKKIYTKNPDKKLIKKFKKEGLVL